MEYEEEYYYIPKILFQDDFYGHLCAKDIVVYSVLRGKQMEAADNGWIDPDGSIYLNYKIEEFAKMFSCGRSAMMAILRRLEEVNLIERERNHLFKYGSKQVIYGWNKPYKTYINEV